MRYAAEQYNVADASTVPVSGRAYLRFDANLRADLDELLASEDEIPRSEAIELVREASQLSTTSAMGELDRMPVEGLSWLVTQYGIATKTKDPGVVRNALKNVYAQEAEHRLGEDVAHLAGACDEQQFLADIRQRLQAPPGDRGRAARVLLAAPMFVPAAIGAEIADAESRQRLMVADFDQTIVYRPPIAANNDAFSDLSSNDLPGLAARYAPVFIQQVNPDASYSADADRIGCVYLEGNPHEIQVRVATNHPTVYWTTSQARINHRRYDQLVYVAWYPSRPALSAGDVEAGNIDGVVVRITLDRHRRPAIYEFVRTCGCYHTLWVAEFVEASARAEFGEPDNKHKFAVKPLSNDRSLFFPALVPDDGTSPLRPNVYIDAGNHNVMSIAPCEITDQPRETEVTQSYSLQPYDALTHLPLGDTVASMFGSNGLVHGAQRKEGFLLVPTGMLSAGQPRQLGTMKIRMDAYDHDDPHLLERSLRLPSNF